MYIDAYTTIARYRGCRLAVTCMWDQLYLWLNIHWLGFAHSQLEDGWLDIGRTAGQYSSHRGMVYACEDEQWRTSSGRGQTRQREMSPPTWFLIGSNTMSLSVYIVIQIMSFFSLYSICTGEKIKTANGNKINRILCNLPHMGGLWHAMEIWGDAMACYVAGLWHHVVI
jgi:hypothetical protein